MPGLQMFKRGFYSHIGSNQSIVAGTINLGNTKGRGSSTRMFNYCKTHSPNPAGCINQFINITPSSSSTPIQITTPITIPTPTLPTLPTPTTPTILVYSLSQGTSIDWATVIFTLDTNLPNYSYTTTVTTSIPATPPLNSSSLIGVTIGNTVTTIGSNAFYNCTNLTSVTIPNSVTTIGLDAFSNCTSLTSITIPDSVTSIDEYVFIYCTSLTSITIPDSVTSIGSFAFSYCTSLTSITIPDSVTSIGSYAFLNSGLTTVTISSATATALGITSPTTNPSGVNFFGITVATILPPPP